MNALQAHLHLLSVLPVRTIPAKPRLIGKGKRITPSLRRQMKRLRKQGLNQQQIADAVCCSKDAVSRNLRKR